MKMNIHKNKMLWSVIQGLYIQLLMRGAEIWEKI